MARCWPSPGPGRSSTSTTWPPASPTAPCRSGAPRPTSSASPPPAACLGFAPDGRSLAVGAAAGAVYLFGADGPERRRFLGHRAAVTALAFSPDGKRLASAADDGTVRVWDAAAPAGGPHVTF